MSRNAEKNWKNKILTEVEDFSHSAFREGRHIPVAEVSIGDKLITRWDKLGNVTKTLEVTDRNPCSGGNGMHVHLNKSNCYDSRSYVWVI